MQEWRILKKNLPDMIYSGSTITESIYSQSRRIGLAYLRQSTHDRGRRLRSGTQRNL
ncbi:hypothetical protein PanWU01x14_094720 [Parasponia andersonii]|uniref:Uncharacterized protein n=1 Tax=Parasponia andersonii TaxID=3476 RepID=A0A2P5D5B9_PARAD|nr:hypothetical protein PanWU01x14_094720 [Parasponia andersonii]